MWYRAVVIVAFRATTINVGFVVALALLLGMVVSYDRVIKVCS